jgi:hypothetical protein
MLQAGFTQIEKLDRGELDIERLRYYPLFTTDFLDWMEGVMERAGAPPIYRLHFRARKPATPA